MSGSSTTATHGRERRRARPSLTRSPAGRLVLAMCIVWVVVAAARPPADAQDAVPLVVAGDLVDEHPEAIYVTEDGSLFDVQPAFRERSCAILEPALDCDDYAVAFVSPPPSVPLAVVLAALGPDLALRLLRVLGALALVGGMVALWDRLAHRSARAPQLLGVTAVAMTPLAMVPIGLGQTSPLMFLSAALGVAAWDRPGWRRASLAALLVAVIAFKLLPVVLLGLLLLERRWRLLALVVGALAVLTLVGLWLGGGVELVEAYVEGSGAVEAQAAENPYNGALDAALYHGTQGALSPEGASDVGLLLRLAALPVLGWLALRLPRGDARWAFAWAAIVVLAPLAWWHYTLASMGSLGVALGERDRSDRVMAVLPGAAVVGIAISIANNRGWAIPVLQYAWAVAALVAVVALIGIGRGTRQGDVPASPAPTDEPTAA